MADFVEKSVNKSAVRDLAVPIPNVEAFDNLIKSIIDDNPFDCIGYVKDGEEMPAVARHREHYTAKVNFVNAGKKVGAVSLQSPTIAAFEANAAAVLANTAIATAMSGDAFRDPAKETYYCQLPQPLHWCGHAPPPNPPDRTGDIHAPHPPAATPILFHTSNVYDPAGR